METRTLLRLVSERVREKKFAEVEALLTRAKAQAAADHDLNAERLILSELIELYCVVDSPDTTKAERIEQMVVARMPFVVGDETLFLERAHKAGLNARRIIRIASSLIPICRDPAFARRLSELHQGR